MDIKTTLEHYLTWFKAHERLVLLLAVLLFGVHFYSKGIDYLVKRDQTQAQIAHDQAVVTATKFNQDDQTNKLLLVELATLKQQIAQQNQRIDEQMRDRQAATTQQKHTDDTMRGADLAARIHTLLGVGTIKVEPSDAPDTEQLVFSSDAAHAVADNLEDLQQVRLDVKDLNTKLDGCKAITDKQTDTITGLTTQIADGKTALVAEQTSHTKDVKELKDQKKKSWLNGYKWGVITGFLGSLFVHKP